MLGGTIVSQLSKLALPNPLTIPQDTCILAWVSDLLGLERRAFAQLFA